MHLVLALKRAALETASPSSALLAEVRLIMQWTIEEASLPSRCSGLVSQRGTQWMVEGLDFCQDVLVSYGGGGNGGGGDVVDSYCLQSYLS